MLKLKLLFSFILWGLIREACSKYWLLKGKPPKVFLGVFVVVGWTFSFSFTFFCGFEIISIEWSSYLMFAYLLPCLLGCGWSLLNLSARAKICLLKSDALMRFLWLEDSICYIGESVLRCSRCNCGGIRCSSYVSIAAWEHSKWALHYQWTLLICVTLHSSLVLFTHSLTLRFIMVLS